MPRVEVNSPRTYTNADLRCAILKLLSLRQSQEGCTAKELAERLCARRQLVEVALKSLHDDFGLVWISSYADNVRGRRGPSSRKFSFSSGGAFCHADVPHPVGKYAVKLGDMYHPNSRWPDIVDFINRRLKAGKMPTYAEVYEHTKASRTTVCKARAYIRLQQHAALKGQK